MLPLKRCYCLCQKPRFPRKKVASGFSSWPAMVGIPGSLESCHKEHPPIAAVRAGQHETSPTWCPGRGIGGFTAKAAAPIGDGSCSGSIPTHSASLFFTNHTLTGRNSRHERGRRQIECHKSVRPLARDSLRNGREIDSLSYALPYFLQPRPGICTVNYAP